jgi:RNA polymerase sigma-70 factor (ECF subfamily)
MDEAGANWRERAIRDAVLAGDSATWRAWFAEYFDRLAAYVRWRCGGLVDLADDAIQDTWLTAVRRLSSFDPDRGTFIVWLRGIAANAVRNAVRARRRHDRRARPLGDGVHRSVGVPDTMMDPGERVAAALAEIPDHYVSVLRAKYFDRLTVEAIAAGRGESVKAIESLLSRARQAFREAYEKPSHD